MSEFIPITDEMLEKARSDRNFRNMLLSEHLNRLMVAMGRTRDRVGTDPGAAAHLQEGARLAVKLTEMLNGVGAKHRG
jgi:hypothetical protein